jgi:hypothetical protein
VIDAVNGTQLANAADMSALAIRMAANIFADTLARSRAVTRGHVAIEMFSARSIWIFPLSLWERVGVRA